MFCVSKLKQEAKNLFLCVSKPRTQELAYPVPNNWTGFTWPRASQIYDQKQLGSLKQDILCFYIRYLEVYKIYGFISCRILCFIIGFIATLGCMPIQDTSSCRF